MISLGLEGLEFLEFHQAFNIGVVGGPLHQSHTHVPLGLYGTYVYTFIGIQSSFLRQEAAAVWRQEATAPRRFPGIQLSSWKIVNVSSRYSC